MRYNIFLILAMLVSTEASFLYAQADSARLEAAFRFQDGVYAGREQLLANRPAHTWDSLNVRLAANPEKYRAQAEYLRHKRTGHDLGRGEVWGIVIDGLPYILLEEEQSNGAMAFAGLRVRGRICYYRFEEDRVREVEITAYNPLTGKPFRKAAVQRPETVEVERIFDLATGQAGPLDLPTVRQLIAGDAQLLRSLEEQEGPVDRERLYKIVLIYDDRNPLWLPVGEAVKNNK